MISLLVLIIAIARLCAARDQIHGEVERPVDAQHVDLVWKVCVNLAALGELLAEVVEARAVRFVFRGRVVQVEDGVLLLPGQLLVLFYDVLDVCGGRKRIAEEVLVALLLE